MNNIYLPTFPSPASPPVGLKWKACFFAIFGLFLSTPYLSAQQEVPEEGSKPNVERRVDGDNGSEGDHTPTVTAGERRIYFVSKRPEGAEGYDFWFVTRENGPDAVFGSSQIIGSPVVTSNHEGPPSITADSRTMYFTACNRSDGEGDCDIYEARWEGEGWGSPRNLNRINSSFREAQPSISSDGKHLYFVSNRPGALGGPMDADIYMSTKGADGEWSAPKNLGAPVNSAFNEDSPMLLPGGQILYFSSKREEISGERFFISRLGTDEMWMTPEKLGDPINSVSNDRFFNLPDAGDLIYFSSVKEEDIDPFMGLGE